MRSGFFSILLGGFALVAIASCGSGGSSSPAVNDQATGGIWLGTWTGGSGGNEDAILLSTDIDPGLGEARFSMLLSPSLIVISGTVTVNGTSVSGSGTAFAPLGDSFPGGGMTTGISFTGTLTEGQTLSGNWTIDAGESGSFAVDYDDRHLRGAALARLNGLWTVYDLPFDENNPVTAGTFDILDGMLFRQSAVCSSSGTITIPDPQFNIYIWNATVISNTPGSCPVEGDFTGLGALSDFDDSNPTPTNDEFDVIISSDSVGVPLLLVLNP